MATIYQRIANPYQKPGANATTILAGSLNYPTPFYAPGEIGCAYNDQNTGAGYARLRLDSGATSATPVGIVAAGQTAFWKDRTNNLVTNDKRMCDAPNAGSVNRVAGIFQTAVSTAAGTNDANGVPVTYVCDVLIQGINVQVASNGNGAAGDWAVSDSTAATARVTSTTAGTAPIAETIGVIRGASANSLIPVDVAIGFLV